MVDYFLKIEGVDGESHDDKHKGEIDVESWSWGESQSGTHSGGGGGGAGKVSMQDFHATMKMNKATPKLMLACANGEHFPKATLTCRKAGKEQQEYFKIIMSDLLVSSYQTGGSAGADMVPIDQFSLNFAKIEFEYKEQDAKGNLGAAIKSGYDLKANKKV
ncbi:MAG TPA: type VI secretion system tube protein Hcp [Tepidisphaeraceae bacterium]|jgi:type VI secretion system secreted protein Hcp|nr:type VI secretion system tube protein Hcp [Tepidisphaeraceae bacterium]